MAALRTAISVLGTLDESADVTTVEAETEVAVKLIAQTATITGMIGRLRAGEEPVDPDPDLSHAGDFLNMLTGTRPDPFMERLMDISLILHADHGMNASTFTAMVTNSSLSDMYSTVVAGICSLKGPLHGGANEQVLYMLDEIGGPEQVEVWFQKARSEHRKIMGIGHRVYKALDPRARILGPLAGLMAELNPGIRREWETATRLEQVVAATISQDKKLFPNVDFYSGIVYRGMGIDTPMFTPIFAVSRVAGWAARVLEYQAENRIFRPRAAYQGPLTASYIPVDDRD
jgi:citrate synthase